MLLLLCACCSNSEFQEVRKEHSFFEVCQTPELACEVTLQVGTICVVLPTYVPIYYYLKWPHTSYIHFSIVY